MKLVSITEENHGLIGIALNRKSAFQFLVKRGWLHFASDYYLFDHWTPIQQIFDDNGWEKTEEALVEWAMMPTLDWEGSFYFDEVEVFDGAKDKRLDQILNEIGSIFDLAYEMSEDPEERAHINEVESDLHEYLNDKGLMD